jgi:hypothetical protein
LGLFFFKTGLLIGVFGAFRYYEEWYFIGPYAKRRSEELTIQSSRSQKKPWLHGYTFDLKIGSRSKTKLENSYVEVPSSNDVGE